MQWTLRRADVIAIATQGNIDGSPYVKPFERKCKDSFWIAEEWEEKVIGIGQKEGSRIKTYLEKFSRRKVCLVK